MERKKGIRRGETCRNREGKPMAQATNFSGRAVMRATQRTARFIRWLRAHVYSEAPLGILVARLAAVWAVRWRTFPRRSTNSEFFSVSASMRQHVTKTATKKILAKRSRKLTSRRMNVIVKTRNADRDTTLAWRISFLLSVNSDFLLHPKSNFPVINWG